jgi:hypothetical protein
MRVAILIVSAVVLAYSDDYTLKLYEYLLPSLFKSSPVVVLADAQERETLRKSRHFLVTNVCSKDVDLLIGSSFDRVPKLCKDKPFFATTRKRYLNHSSAFGAFYWRKGRPQIHFKKEALKRFHLTLPAKLQRFIDE